MIRSRVFENIDSGQLPSNGKESSVFPSLTIMALILMSLGRDMLLITGYSLIHLKMSLDDQR